MTEPAPAFVLRDMAGESRAFPTGRPSLVAFVKEDYKRGVRTYVSKWMSNGQVVERSYTVRDR